MTRIDIDKLEFLFRELVREDGHDYVIDLIDWIDQHGTETIAKLREMDT